MYIRKKLPLDIICLLLIPLTLLGFISIKYFSVTLIKNSKNSMENVINIGSKQLEDLILKQQLETKSIAEKNRIIKYLSNNNTQSNIKHTNLLLKNIQNMSGDIKNTLIIDKNGNIILNENKTTYEFKFFNLIKNNKNIFNTFQILNKKELADNFPKDYYAITYPILDSKDEPLGILVNIYSYENIEKRLKNIKIGSSGGIFLADFNKNLLLNSKENANKLILSNEIKEIIEDIKDKDIRNTGITTVGDSKTGELVGYKYIKKCDWILFCSEKLSEINTPVQKIMYVTVIITIVFFSWGIFIAVRFSKSITDPITNLMNTMERATGGDLLVNEHYKDNNEIVYLSKSFNIMLKELKENYGELSAVYEQLASTEEELRLKYDELKDNEEKLKNIQEKYKLALNGSNDAIWEYDIKTKKFYTSEKWKDIIGIEVKGKIENEQDLIRFLKVIVHKEYREMVVKRYIYRRNTYGTFKSEFKLNTKKDKWILVKGNFKTDDSGNVSKICGIVMDITYRKKDEEKIKFLAYYDTLTLLPNRTYLLDKISHDIRKSIKNKEKGVLFFINIDDFKRINDDLGHYTGDQFLKKFSKKLYDFVNNRGFLCRFCGDEFIVIINNIGNKDEIKRFAEGMLNSLSRKFIVENKYIYCSISIGIARFPEDGDCITTILKNSDIAMHKAKDRGKNRLEFYNLEMSRELKRKNQIEFVLRDAIKNNELELYYQPQIDCKTEKIYGFEALLRLNSKEIGFISPDEFIPIAEDTGLIIPIGNWVVKQVCKQDKIWRDKGYKYNKIALNISGKQLKYEGFLNTVKGIIKKIGNNPKNLEFEITESVFVDFKDEKIQILKELQKMGITISLDDFGTGYSSFNYLRILPIDNLKIDKSFVNSISKDKDKNSIIDGVILIARNMNLKIIAEGVETREQYSILKNKKCDLIQGYLFSKPVPISIAETYFLKE